MKIRGWIALLPLWLGACASGPDPATADPATFDAQFPAAIGAMPIPSAGHAMLARAYIAQGAGPHPAVILMHGMPGNEQNIDLAQAMRRAGWTVLMFHYRGAWGSAGDFGFANAVDDVGAALAYARSAEAAQGLRLDPARIVLVGHSLGSFAALQAAARDPRVKAIAAISPWSPHVAGAEAARDPQVRQQVQEAYQSAMGPLKGTSGETLTEEAMRRGPDWRFERLAPQLAGRSVLLVGGTRDRGTKLYLAPLATALKATPSVRLSEAVIDTDHNFSDRRVALARVVIAWLDGQR